jgi:hypothetical protein
VTLCRHHPAFSVVDLPHDYVFIEDADALYAEYAARSVEFARGIANIAWHSREFVVKDRGGRLLAFGANL